MTYIWAGYSSWASEPTGGWFDRSSNTDIINDQTSTGTGYFHTFSTYYSDATVYDVTIGSCVSDVWSLTNPASASVRDVATFGKGYSGTPQTWTGLNVYTITGDYLIHHVSGTVAYDATSSFFYGRAGSSQVWAGDAYSDFWYSGTASLHVMAEGSDVSATSPTVTTQSTTSVTKTTATLNGNITDVTGGNAYTRGAFYVPGSSSVDLVPTGLIDIDSGLASGFGANTSKWNVASGTGSIEWYYSPINDFTSLSLTADNPSGTDAMVDWYPASASSYSGKTITWQMWCYAYIANQACLQIYDSQDGSTWQMTQSSYASAGSAQLLTVTRTLRSGLYDPIGVVLRCAVLHTHSTQCVANFDGSLAVCSSTASPIIVPADYYTWPPNLGYSTGTFTKNLSGLTKGTTYSYRAYAMNELGTGVGLSLIHI